MADEPNDEKREYTKPEIKQVALRPDEAVLGACKASSGGGGQWSRRRQLPDAGAVQLARLLRRECTSELPASRFKSPAPRRI